MEAHSSVGSTSASTLQREEIDIGFNRASRQKYTTGAAVRSGFPCPAGGGWLWGRGTRVG